MNPEREDVKIEKDSAYRKKYEDLLLENESLRDQIEMLKIEKEMITREKSAIEAKYKKKLSDILS